MHTRLFFAAGAALLAFAAEGFQGLAATVLGGNSLGAQAAIIGTFLIGYAFLELFGKKEPPHQHITKPGQRRKQKRDRRGRFVKK